MGLRFEGVPKGFALAFAGKEGLVGADDPAGVFGVFFEEFEAELAESGGFQLGEEFGAGLRDCVEEGIAAADVGAQGVFHSDAVAQAHPMLFARSPAIGEIPAIGHERGEYAVLHVKHGHVLMDR